jgi:hypothetical protein
MTPAATVEACQADMILTEGSGAVLVTSYGHDQDIKQQRSPISKISIHSIVLLNYGSPGS